MQCPFAKEHTSALCGNISFIWTPSWPLPQRVGKKSWETPFWILWSSWFLSPCWLPTSSTTVDTLPPINRKGPKLLCSLWCNFLWFSYHFDVWGSLDMGLANVHEFLPQFLRSSLYLFGPGSKIEFNEEIGHKITVWYFKSHHSHRFCPHLRKGNYKGSVHQGSRNPSSSNF